MAIKGRCRFVECDCRVAKGARYKGRGIKGTRYKRGEVKWAMPEKIANSQTNEKIQNFAEELQKERRSGWGVHLSYR